MSSIKTEFPQSVQTYTQFQSSPQSWQIKLLYDSECPLCMREVNFLQRRDAGRGGGWKKGRLDIQIVFTPTDDVEDYSS